MGSEDVYKRQGVASSLQGIADPIVQPKFPMFFDLGCDPGERYNLFQFKLDMGWMFGVAFSSIAQFEKTVAE